MWLSCHDILHDSLTTPTPLLHSSLSLPHYITIINQKTHVTWKVHKLNPHNKWCCLDTLKYIMRLFLTQPCGLYVQMFFTCCFLGGICERTFFDPWHLKVAPGKLCHFVLHNYKICEFANKNLFVDGFPIHLHHINNKTKTS
jgi:hypothetical protein